MAWRVKRIKIGYCKWDLEGRLKRMQIDSPVRLKYIKVVVGEIEDEKAIHKRLEKYKSHGEWFNWTPQVRNIVKNYGGTLAQIAELPKETSPVHPPSTCGDCGKKFPPAIKGATSLLCRKCAFIADQDPDIQSVYRLHNFNINPILTRFNLRQSYHAYGNAES